VDPTEPVAEPVVFVNPARRTSGAASGATAVRTFHRRMPGYAPTPIVDAPAIAAGLDLATVSVKVESERLGLPAFKILGASWAVYSLLVERLGDEPQWGTLDELRAALTPLGPLTFAAATDGNHGRAVAHMAKLLGYPAQIFVPAGTADARISGIEEEGASVTVVDGSYDDAVATAAKLASENVLVVSDTSWEGYTEVPRTVIAGYRTIFDEVDEQLGAEARPDLVVVPFGVGALTAAVVDHYSADALVVAVEPHSAAAGLHSAQAGHPVEVPPPHDSIMAGLNCGTVSAVAWPAVVAGVDAFVAIADTDAEQAMRDLAAIGVVAGETGAASLAGLRAVVTAGVLPTHGRRALVLCTEGATDPVAYRRIVGRNP
jgi:diaminopropionate ammonia-lyase